MLLSSGGGTWGTDLYTVRGVGSGSRDVDAWRASGRTYRGLQVPMDLDHGPVTSSGKSVILSKSLRFHGAVAKYRKLPTAFAAKISTACLGPKG